MGFKYTHSLYGHEAFIDKAVISQTKTSKDTYFAAYVCQNFTVKMTVNEIRDRKSVV